MRLSPNYDGCGSHRLQCGVMRPRSAIRNRLEYAAAFAVLKSLEWRRCRWRNAGAGVCPATRSRDSATATVGGVQSGHSRCPEKTRRASSTAYSARSRGCWWSSPISRPSAGNVARLDPLRGRRAFREGDAHGRGVLFATAHLGNWELSAFAHALLTGPMHVVVRPLDNPLIDALVERRRALSGNWLISKTDSARTILRALEKIRR